MHAYMYGGATAAPHPGAFCAGGPNMANSCNSSEGCVLVAGYNGLPLPPAVRRWMTSCGHTQPTPLQLQVSVCKLGTTFRRRTCLKWYSTIKNAFILYLWTKQGAEEKVIHCFGHVHKMRSCPYHPPVNFALH